jgi:hypothetical protein
MRFICALILFIYSTSSFGLTVHSCVQVLDYSEADAMTQAMIKEHTLGFFNGYLLGRINAPNDIVSSERLWMMSTDAVYRFILAGCEENPDKDVQGIVDQLIATIK